MAAAYEATYGQQPPTFGEITLSTLTLRVSNYTHFFWQTLSPRMPVYRFVSDLSEGAIQSRLNYPGHIPSFVLKLKPQKSSCTFFPHIYSNSPPDFKIHHIVLRFNWLWTWQVLAVAQWNNVKSSLSVSSSAIICLLPTCKQRTRCYWSQMVTKVALIQDSSGPHWKSQVAACGWLIGPNRQKTQGH